MPPEVEVSTMASRGFTMKKFEDIFESKHPEEEYRGTVLRLIGRDLGAQFMAMSMAILKPGQRIPLHSHPTAEEIHVLFQGKSRVLVETEEFDVEAITALRFPPGSPRYGVINSSDRDAVWLFVGAPIDEYRQVYKQKFGESGAS
jgi:quercetin dioxygenase-like cupin family protein